MTDIRLNENILTMTYKEFTKWCNDRAFDGKCGYHESVECISIINKINSLPIWKRNKCWKEKYEFDIVNRIVNRTNCLINKYNENNNSSDIKDKKEKIEIDKLYEYANHNLDLINNNLQNIRMDIEDNINIYEFLSHSNDRKYYNQDIILDVFKMIDTLSMILNRSNKYSFSNKHTDYTLYCSLKEEAVKNIKLLYESDTISEIIYLQFDRNLMKSELNIYEFITDYILNIHEGYTFPNNKDDLLEYVKECIQDSDDLNIIDFNKPFTTIEIELNEDDYILIKFPTDIRLISFFKQGIYNTFKEFFINNH